MSQPSSEPRGLDPMQARRMLSALTLRPNDRILCLGRDGGTIPGVAAILVGPTGHIVEADHTSAATSGTLPYNDGEFDAVVIDLTTPHPQHSRLLGEVARVTAPTGRITFAVPRPADGDPTPVQQLAEQAGLRGVALRSDTGTDPGGAPVEFVTAFPPVPAEPGDEPDNMSEIHLPKPAAEPTTARRRHLPLVSAAAALALVAAVGVGWALTGAGPDDDEPDGGTDLLAGDTELDIDEPGTRDQLAAEDPRADGGLPTDDPDSDSGSAGTGTGSGSDTGSGGDRPSNLPPLIESPGLSSTGLLLTIAPEVTDPDGDDVSLLFDVNGMEVDPAHTCSHPSCKGEEYPEQYPTVAGVRLDLADVGYEADVPVTIIATDAHGATSRETYSHTVSARTRVSFRDVNYAINDPSDCFSDTETRVLSFTQDIDGAFIHHLSRDRTINASSASGTLDRDVAGIWTGKPPPPLEVSLSVSLSDIGTTAFAAPRSFSDNYEGALAFGRRTQCEGVVTYRITFETS